MRVEVAAAGLGRIEEREIAAVERQLRPYRGYRKVVVLLSDGQVNSSAAALRHQLTRLRAAADGVYFVGLDADGAWSSNTHTFYEHRGLTDVLTLQRFAPNAFAQTLAQIVLRETGQRMHT